MKKAKMICTIGPASASVETLTKMIQSGMDVARLNFSHGSHDYHLKTIQLIREASQRAAKPVAILQDLQGIKIRIGLVENGAVMLNKNQTVTLTSKETLSNANHIYIAYPNLMRDVEVGHRILINDGLIKLIVKTKNADSLEAVVLEGGFIKDKKGVNLPDTTVTLDAFTAKDKADLDFGLQAGVDYIALSFVRDSGDVLMVKRHIQESGLSARLIAKIEMPSAVQTIDAIIQEADGIMVARGDLAVEMSPEAVPFIQKDCVVKANRAGKLVIVATQMLESMTENSTPTRAEASDVANAVIDGADALMLSGETASGKYPVETVQMMSKIIEHSEFNLLKIKKEDSEFDNIDMSLKHKKGFPYAVADAACKASDDVNADCILAFTRSGATALMLSKNRPKTRIAAFTENQQTMRQLCLCWGVEPFMIKTRQSVEAMLHEIQTVALRKNILKIGHTAVITSCSAISEAGGSHFIKLHTIGDAVV
jgi:pyruvate kinase